MTRYVGALLMGLLLFGVGKVHAGWPGGIFASLSSAILTLFMGTLVRGRAMRKAPEAPPLQSGEVPLLHGPVELMEKDGQRDCWAYLSNQRLSLLPSDGDDGSVLWLKSIEEIRPPRQRLLGQDPLGLVSAGKLWQLKVPDVDRWVAVLRSALREWG